MWFILQISIVFFDSFHNLCRIRLVRIRCLLKTGELPFSDLTLNWVNSENQYNSGYIAPFQIEVNDICSERANHILVKILHRILYLIWYSFNFQQIKVMHKQLVLLHNAVSAYFSGNATALEGTLKQFNIKVTFFIVAVKPTRLIIVWLQLKSPNSVTGSWLEQ